MSYQPLAIKYRPQNFEQLVGQYSVSKALSNSVRLGRIPNAIILAGVRGTGKTTIARIYAKALNCSNPNNGSPCLSCDNCIAITRGVHEDVVEIDGASNTGVDDIRNLKETTMYVPQRGKYKIYIIDEVHMLSTSAFNALLKTLEEPPSNVVFIFATTEIQKIPETILSRCQTFFLEKISYSDIFSRLSWILTQEGIVFDNKALNIIVKESGGSLRDALTLLDKTIVLGGGAVSLESVSKISASGSVLCLDLLVYLQQKDWTHLYSGLDSFEKTGIELTKVIDQLIKITRHSFILKESGVGTVNPKTLGLDDSEYEKILDIIKYYHPLELNALFRLLIKCRSDLTKTDLDRYIIENYFMEWCILSKNTSFVKDSKLDSGSKSNLNLDSKIDSSSVSEASFTSKLSSSELSSTPTLERKDINNNELNSSSSSSFSSLNLKSSNLISELSSSLKEELNNSSLKDTSKQSGSEILDRSSSDEDSTTIPLKFPDSWEQLVETWKKQKPFQARILEEVIPEIYSKDLICLLVNRGSLAASQLLQEARKKALKNSFSDLFGFNGQLKIITEPLANNQFKNSSMYENPNIKQSKDSPSDLSQDSGILDPTNKDEDILDNNASLLDNELNSSEHMSILDKKNIQRQQREKILTEKLSTNCITQLVEKTFKDSKITSITVDG